MEVFKNQEAEYASWLADHSSGFVLNRFGGSNPAFNVLHRAKCVFLRRDCDEGSRTAVEKWCSDAENELTEEANAVLGSGMWRRCGVCFRSAPVAS